MASPPNGSEMAALMRYAVTNGSMDIHYATAWRYHTVQSRPGGYYTYDRYGRATYHSYEATRAQIDQTLLDLQNEHGVDFIRPIKDQIDDQWKDHGLNIAKSRYPEVFNIPEWQATLRDKYVAHMEYLYQFPASN